VHGQHRGPTTTPRCASPPHTSSTTRRWDPTLTSDVRPQRLVVFLQQIVEDARGVLVVRPGDQHLVDTGVVGILVVGAIIQWIRTGGRGGGTKGGRMGGSLILLMRCCAPLLINTIVIINTHNFVAVAYAACIRMHWCVCVGTAVLRACVCVQGKPFEEKCLKKHHMQPDSFTYNALTPPPPAQSKHVNLYSFKETSPMQLLIMHIQIYIFFKRGTNPTHRAPCARSMKRMTPDLIVIFPCVDLPPPDHREQINRCNGDPAMLLPPLR